MKPESIAIVFSCSQQYLDYVCVSMWSVLSAGSENDRYDFFIFHCGIDNEAEESFRSYFSGWPNQTITFVNIQMYMKNENIDEDDLTGKETVFGLLAPYVLEHCDQIIVIDGDTVVRRDLRCLWDTDIGRNLAGAVLDPDFIGQYHSGNKHYKEYYSNEVPIERPYEYVQGGVLLLNAEEIRKTYPEPDFFKLAIARKYKYDEQDIINQHYTGRISFLDMRWNVMHDNDRYRVRFVISLAPRKIYMQYLESRKNPWIIHFAGGDKPWNNPKCDFAHEFWAVAERTPVGELLRNRQAEYRPSDRFVFAARRIYCLCKLVMVKCTMLLRGIHK
jgi:lipopolysaccharide biosynthesis glycosyltransferase